MLKWIALTKPVKTVSDQHPLPKPLKECLPRQDVHRSELASRRFAAHYDGVVRPVLFGESPYGPQVFAANAGTFDLDGDLSP